MLITFKTKAHADITMFGDNALTLLKMMGRSSTVPSAMLAEDVPEALSRLAVAIAKVKSASPSENPEQEEAEISIIHRTLPLINLLNAATKANCSVMWTS